jgi:hypothetical protein
MYVYRCIKMIDKCEKKLIRFLNIILIQSVSVVLSKWKLQHLP